MDESDGDIIVKMDDDDWFGPHYADDLALTLEFSGAGLASKASHVVHFTNEDRRIVRNPGFEYTYVSMMGGGSLAIRREVLEQVQWRPLPSGEDMAFVHDCRSRAVPILSSDRFHYVYKRRTARDHTAVASTREIEHNARIESLHHKARDTDFQP
jgi:hypothetical protein